MENVKKYLSVVFFMKIGIKYEFNNYDQILLIVLYKGKVGVLWIVE